MDSLLGADINICENIIACSRLFPERDALIFEDERLSYSGLERMTAHAAGVLSELGIERGDRVALVIPNVPAFAVWYYGCLRLGAIAVSISTRLSESEVAFILGDCGAKAAIGTDSLVDRLGGELPACTQQVLQVSEDGVMIEDLPLLDGPSISDGACRQMEPDDPATILYTSGTTGFPKGATLSHQNVRATVHAFNHLCGMQTSDRILLSVPLFHCYGQNALLNSGLNIGATIVMQRRFDLSQAKQLIGEHQISMLFGVPTTFQLMLESCTPSDLDSVRYCFSAAATLPVQVSDAWRQKFGMPIYEGYGLTETAPFASYNHELHFVPGSIGTPVDLVEMKIVDPDSGDTCAPGVPGEIAIRGPNVMLGYWNRPEETAAAIRDGWFYSGDIGQVDQRGYFFILDRLKDMIVVGGLKVFPAEVERVLLDHDGVAEAAVVGMADAVLGERVVAFLVASDPDQPPDAKQVQQYCQARLGSYKVPTRIKFLSGLPRNPAGKVLKTTLREQELPRLGEATATIEPVAETHPHAGDPSPEVLIPEIGPLLDRLRNTHPASRAALLSDALAEELQALSQRDQAPDPDASILDDQMDSLMIVEFRDRLQALLGARHQLSATIVFDHPRISDLAPHLLAIMELTATNVGPRDAATSVQPKSQKKPSDPPQSRETIEQMSEQQAMEALLREVND